MDQSMNKAEESHAGQAVRFSETLNGLQASFAILWFGHKNKLGCFAVPYDKKIICLQ